MTADRSYRDLQEHIEALDAAGLLHRIDAPVNKDTQMHPLVRWQYRGGIEEPDRKAFLFTNVTDSRGRKYDIPVVIGALAGTAEIYRIGMDCDLADVGQKWSRAIANPIGPVEVTDAPCQQVVMQGDALKGEGNGVDALPVPISTPGFDAGPYLTAATWITADPDDGVQNMGVYRGNLKAPDRIAVMMLISLSAGGYYHWKKYKARGQKMPVCIVLGCPPAVEFTGPQKLQMGQDELGVAGALAGGPIHVVKAVTNDLRVPADAEVIIEGLIDDEYLEPEGPFGESHGYVALEEFNLVMQVTAITRKRAPVIPSIISQVTPSESSVIKRVAYEPLYLSHLRDTMSVKGVVRVSLHEPLTNLRRVVLVQFERGVAKTEIWRALYGAASLQPATGKYVIAINEDIDPENGDAVFWALGYRANPALDVQILGHRARGHGPVLKGVDSDSTMLIDATLKADMPPVALPKEEFMLEAKALWEELGLPKLKPESPWHGYSLGDWSDRWEQMARRATDGDYLRNGEITWQQRRKVAEPQTPIADVLDDVFGADD
ncbi:MAG: UbiD family decarboxylase [Pseudomonadota bacterium]